MAPGCSPASELVLGDAADTVALFLAGRPAPVAFISFDLDLCSATAEALSSPGGRCRRASSSCHCYFDDITGYTYTEFNGERLATREFNERNVVRKISPIYLSHYVPTGSAGALWVEKMHLAYIFDHPLYGRPDGLTRVARKDLS
jgi:hypothetical protein